MIGLIIRPDLQFRHLVFEIMRGKLKTSFLVSEDMALVEGTEVEIVDIRYGCETYYMCKFQCQMHQSGNHRNKRLYFYNLHYFHMDVH